MKRSHILVAAVSVILLIAYFGSLINHAVHRDIQLKHTDVQLESKQAEVNKLQLQYKTLNSKFNQELQKNVTDDAALQQLQKEKDELDRQNRELLQARADRKAESDRIAAAANKVANTITGTATAYADPGSAKAFIYMKESGNNPGAINASSGACGLGQALPCSKMGCSLSDYACQDRFFTQYAMNRYGSWENAKAFWLANKWW